MRLEGLIYVITGEKGAGKSTVCAGVARKAADLGLTVAGILTERGDDTDPGSPRRVVDLRSGKGRSFGSRDRECAKRGREGAAPEGASDGMVTTDPLTPGWDFDSGVFAWVDAVLSRATPCDLLVIDELGPLELLGGRGWATALDVLRSHSYGVALVVCRPHLLEKLSERVDAPPNGLFEVTPQVRDSLPADILEALLAQRSSGYARQAQSRRAK